jgi:hypothetical protein
MNILNDHFQVTDLTYEIYFHYWLSASGRVLNWSMNSVVFTRARHWHTVSVTSCRVSLLIYAEVSPSGFPTQVSYTLINTAQSFRFVLLLLQRSCWRTHTTAHPTKCRQVLWCSVTICSYTAAVAPDSNSLVTRTLSSIWMKSVSILSAGSEGTGEKWKVTLSLCLSKCHDMKAYDEWRYSSTQS